MAIKEQFEEFHAKNHDVYRVFVKYARMARDRGFHKFGAKAVFERLRWHFSIETSGDIFLLNNNYTAYYARKAMAENEDLRGLFHTRERKNK